MMEPTKTTAADIEQEDIFQEGEFIEYTEASVTQRLINYIIDVILMRLGMSWLTSYLLVMLLMAVSPNTAYALFSDEADIFSTYLIAVLNHLVYYTFCEKAFRGYTLGKLVTGTRVIREDGEELTLKDALLRSLCRLVPFEAFSIWSDRGLWHDTWTKTKVIQTR